MNQANRASLARVIREGRAIKIPGGSTHSRAERPRDLDPFERRLKRLATFTTSTWVGEGEQTIAYDFRLDNRTPSNAKMIARRFGFMTAENFQRGGGTNRSVAILKRDDSGEYGLQEYCIRLPEPLGGLSEKEIRESVASLVREITPPPGTAVWCRPGMLRDAFTGKDYTKRVPYFKQKMVHIGAQESSGHPEELLDFIAELMPSYRERFLWLSARHTEY